MPVVPKPKLLSWTFHAQAKMGYYRLSPQRVRRVLNAPKRVEEGIAPKTVAAMQPAALKKDAWTQEIWVMYQDSTKERKVISAWRYPGVTKPRDPAALERMRHEFQEFGKSGETAESAS